MSKRAYTKANRAIMDAVTGSRREVFAALSRYDSGLKRRMEREARRIRQRVMRMADLTPRQRNAQLARLTRQRLLAVMRGEEGRIRDGIVAAAERGVSAGTISAEQAAQLGAIVMGAESEAAMLAPTAASDALFARRLVPPRLSRTLRTNARQTAQRMAAQLQSSLQQGDGVINAATSLLRTEDPIVHLPRFVQDLRAAVQSGQPGEVRSAARAAMRYANGLSTRDPSGPVGLRAAARQLASRARAGRTAEIERQVNYWIQDRARYQAQRVAQTEMARAYSEAYVQASSASANVKGLKWTLSASHPDPDICDQFAETDVAGMGPGVYPSGSGIPPLPAHPHCLCFTVVVLRTPQEIASGRDAARGRSQTHAQWMRAQPQARQEAILGPGRARQFRRSGRSVIAADGTHRPLWQAQGRARPRRNLGPRVDVRRTRPGLLPLRDPRRAARGPT